MPSIFRSKNIINKQILIRDKLDPNLLKICAHCNICRDQCPMYQISPKESNFPGGKIRAIYTYIEEKIPIDENLFEKLFLCSTCGQCETVCPISVPYISIIEQLRYILNKSTDCNSLNHLKFPDYIIDHKNPYNESSITRCRWIDETIEPYLKKTGKFAYFVGCTAAYRHPDTAYRTAKILAKMLPDGFVLLREDEYCCGSPLIRTGTHKRKSEHKKESFNIKNFITHNLSIFKKKGVKVIITSCAGCYKTMKEDWPKIINQPLPFKVLHLVQFLDQYKKKLIPFLKPLKKTVTYHDPCHLGRAMGEYSAPRNVLTSIPNLTLIEMTHHHENAICCGAGGGVKANFPNTAQHLAIRRIEDALETQADILTTACVFCKHNLIHAHQEQSSQPLQILNIEDLIYYLLEFS